jgi:arylsulfatase
MIPSTPLLKDVASVGIGLIGLMAASSLGISQAAPVAQANPPAPQRPNILLILADDLGWSDLGCYGSEIHTPNIDALAQDGLRLTQFYTSARCCPSRASLLTGLHPHQAGFPEMTGVLSQQAVTLPEVLKTAGYHTYMVGKWHLNEHNTPVMRGFDEFYGMLGGFNSYWQEKPYYTRLPEGRPGRTYAPGQFYSTDVFGDYTIDFLNQAERDRTHPWFTYLAFNAPHFPLHAYEEDIARYEPIYAQGWDKLRAQRLERQKKLGLVPSDFRLTPRSLIPANWVNVHTGWADKDNPAWDTVPEDRRRDLARRMAVYAACVERLDRNVGRVLAHLKETGQFDNTLILFTSDNGACAEWDPWGFDTESGPNNILHRGDDLKKVGGPGGYISYGSAWANLSNTPWRLYKHYGEEGGIATPFIAHWPAGMKRHGVVDARPTYLTDVMPTCVEVSGATYPARFNGHDILPEEGASLVPALHGETAQPRTLFMEHEGNRAAREPKWKLVALKGKPWELYDMETDRGEMHDLARQHPDIVARLSLAWNAWADRIGAHRPDAAVAATPQIANKALTISCEVETQAHDGVILAQGGDQYGYALHLHDGKLIFSVRIARKLTAITSASTVQTTRFAVQARLNRDGSMQLSVNDHLVAAGKAPGVIPVQPQDELSIGSDTRSAVGDYTPPFTLRGTVSDVRVVLD